MVASYGDIAAIVGGGCDARTVGYALNEMPKQRAGVPWQRIISKEGGISTRGLAQRQLLEEEGVEFDARGHVIMARFRWDGPSAEWAAAARLPDPAAARRGRSGRADEHFLTADQDERRRTKDDSCFRRLLRPSSFVFDPTSEEAIAMTPTREAVIVEAVRTPVGRRGGRLKAWHPVDLLAHTLDALVARAGIDPARSTM